MIEALGDEWRATLEAVARERGVVFGDAGAVRVLSGAYNELGGKARAGLTGAGALGARLSFFFPRDVSKAAGAVREVAAAGLLGQGALRVLDLGAGLGASTWGIARVFAAVVGGEVAATLVDDDGAALEVAAAIARARGGPVRATCVTGDVARFSTGERFDVVVLGQVLAELGASEDEDAARLAVLLERNVAEHGTLLVIEPALRPRARHLQGVRDRLVARGVTVFAPCLRAGSCPMLANQRDWCHEDLEVDLPGWLVPIARAAGLRWQGLTFSYLALRRDGRSLAALHPAGLRVVSRPLVTKGKRELELCGAGGLSRVVRLDRDATPANTAYGAAGRGAILRIAPPPAAPGPARIGKDATVEVDVAGAER